MFMSDDDKKIYSMVQRLGNLDKDYKKEKEVKRGQSRELKRKREEKVNEKRAAYNKQNRVDRYKKAQGGRNQGGNKFGGKKES